MTQRSGTPTTDGPGTVVTFYSFKGGTGRTMALANIAWILASNGKRVLTMDWDLEAPGLHRYFAPFLGDPGLDSTPGVIDLIRAFDSLDPKPPAERYPKYARIERYASTLVWEFPNNGYVDFVSSGRQTPEYSRTVNTYDWRGFHERRGGSAFLDALRRDMQGNYDYALIDSRTGFSDTSGITTLQLPDVLVNCFTFNTQAIKGTADVARDVQRISPRVRILPVPMRVEDAELTKLEVSRDHARERFRQTLQGLSESRQERYWGDVEIPYKAFYAYEEILATVGDRPRQENTLLAAYERLTSVITEGEITALEPIAEDQRRELLARFERVRGSGPGQRTRVRIDFAARDRMWAEWISAQLRATGATVSLRDSSPSFTRLAAPEHANAAPEIVIALLSPDFMTTPLLDEVRRLAATSGPGNQRVVGVRPVEYIVSPDLMSLPTVSLSGKGPEAAGTELFALLGLNSANRASDDGVRFPGSVSRARRVPPRNDSFTGRDDILEELRTRLGTNALRAETAVGMTGLYGLGGMGKTQIALEYVHRYGAQYDVVWWVSADQLNHVPRTIAELGEGLGVPGDSVAERAQAAITALARGDFGRFLLVFDNVSDNGRPADSSGNPAFELRNYLPPNGPGHVIVTARHSDTVSVPDLVHVDTFSRRESVALLRRRLDGLSGDDASRVAEALGDLPMAVEQAAAWLRTTVMPVDTYLRQLREQVSKTLSTATVPSPGRLDPQASLTAVWQLSFDRLRQERPAAARMLEMCAFMSPEPIASSLLYNDAMRDHLAEFDPAVRDSMMLGYLVGDLGRYALARVDQRSESIQVHRLLQAAIREWISEDPAKLASTRHQVHRILAAARPPLSPTLDENSAEARRRYAELWPHLESSGAVESDDPQVREWIVGQLRNTWRINDHHAAVALGWHVLSRWRERIGHDALTLRLAAQLANPLRSLAQYEAAYELDTDTLQRQRDQQGADHPHTLVTARNYGADLRALGRYTEAHASDVDTLTLCRRVFGYDHEHTLNAANNLGVSLNLVGRTREALALDVETYQRRRQVMGLKHLLTWGTANSVAQGQRDMGDYKASRDLLLETRKRLVDLVGEGAPDVLRTDRSLAVTRRRLGEFQGAVALSRSTLAAYRERFGDLHPDTLACLANLTCDLYAIGADDRSSYAEASRLGKEAYLGYQEVLGESHPFTLAAAANWSLCLRQGDEPESALELATTALAQLEQTVGTAHPAAIACRSARAGALSALGRHQEAAVEDTAVHTAFLKLFKDRHPRTVCADYNAALEKLQSGEQDAEREISAAAHRLEGVLDPEHPVHRTVSLRRRVDFDLEMPPT